MSPEATELYKWTFHFIFEGFWRFVGVWMLVAAFKPFRLFPSDLTFKRGKD